MQFGSFQQFFSSGAWKQVLQMLQQQMQGREQQQEVQDPILQQEGQAVQEQGIGGLMPQAPGMAYGGTPGADGRRQYGIGSWFQKKIMDPIKKNPLITAAILAGGSNYLLPESMGGGWIDRALQTNVGQGLAGIMKDPKWMIPAASLVAGAFAKPQEQLEGGAMSRGAGINLQDIAKLANITDERQGQAIGLNFLPEASARKYSPEEMALTYSQAAQGGRIGAQEGGLMDLGGMEKDYRNDGGFVPLGGEEKADDVPARLSRNEFVFTADAVRNAGAGDMDRGAQVMENVMKNLEGGGRISDESQGKGAGEMFEVSERLSEVV